LKHRYSEDLGFFTAVPNQVASVRSAVETCAKAMGAHARFTRVFDSFVECFFEVGGEILQLHFALDSPYRLQPVQTDHPIGFPVDNVVDIACNKMSALFERAAGKDFVDVYFIHSEVMPLTDLVARASEKHVGIEGYWLAVAFQRVQLLQELPRMIKPLGLHTLKQFFLTEAKRLMDDLWPPK